MIASASRSGGCGCGRAAPGTRAESGCGCDERGPRAVPGACECAGPERCGVPCLERPLYSAGQLLTADALRLGQRYLEDRLALRRYVDGVGVVCGLHVRCDPARPGWIVVEPGYAVDCCGRDLVVCEPVAMDLCGAVARCPRPPQPCGDVGSARVAVTREPEWGEVTELAPSRRMLTYALRAEPVWEGRDPVPVITRRESCDPRPECRPSRETSSLRLCVEPLEETPPHDGALERTHRFRQLGTPLFERLGQVIGGTEGSARARAIVDTLLRAIDHDPPRTACGARGLLCALRAVLSGQGPPRRADGAVCDLPPEIEANPEWFLAGLVATLVDGLREDYLTLECDDCCPRAGVRLAHVVVDERLAACGGDGCFIAAIDTHPPGREALHPRSGWWRSDRVSLYDAYFRGADEAGVLLTARGLRVSERDVGQSEYTPTTLPGSVSEWLRSLRHDEWKRLGVYRESELYAPYGSNVTLWTVGRRVVAIEVTSWWPGDQGPYTIAEYVRHSLRPAADTAPDAGGGEEAVESRRAAPAADTAPSPTPAPASVPTAAAGDAVPVEALDPAPFEKTIDRVGRKTEAQLFRAGIRTYPALAGAEYQEVRGVLGGSVPMAREQFDSLRAQARAIVEGERVFDPAELRRWSAEAAARLAQGEGRAA